MKENKKNEEIKLKFNFSEKRANAQEKQSFS